MNSPMPVAHQSKAAPGFSSPMAILPTDVRQIQVGSGTNPYDIYQWNQPGAASPSYYLPSAYNLNKGNQAFTAAQQAQIAKLGGTPVMNGNRVAGWTFPNNPSQILLSNQGGLQTGVQGYRPGENKGKENWTTAAIVGGIAAGPILGAAGVLGGAAGAAGPTTAEVGAVGGYEIPAGVTAGGLPAAAGVGGAAGGAAAAESAAPILLAEGTSDIPSAAAGTIPGTTSAASPAAATTGAVSPYSPAVVGGSWAPGGPASLSSVSGDIALPASATAPMAGSSAAPASSSTGLFGGGGFLGTGLSSGQAALLGGTLGTSLLLGRQKIPQQGALNANQALQPGALQNIQSAQAGNITPSQTAQITQWQQNQVSAASQYLESAGMGGIFKDPKTGKLTADSTAGLQLLANIDQQALAMKQGFADQLFQQSLAELGVADNATQTLVGLEMQRQQSTQQALSSFLLAYGMLGGFGGFG